jgi:hypothetical protein
MKKGKLIGKGSFTYAYLREDGKVFLQSKCPIKECMAMGWFPDSNLFPQLERLGWSEDRKEDFQDYRMDYYPKVKSLKNNLDKDQYQIYKDLRALSVPYCDPQQSFFRWHEEFDKLENEELREVMKEALDACGNYGTTIGFEISPRNVAVENGKLILLDCFYDISKLR